MDRGASWSPANRFEKLHVDVNDLDVVDVEIDEGERPRRDDAILSRRHKDNHYAQQQSRCRLRNESESLSWLRARLHLLLCATDSRISGLFCRARFREQNHGENKCAGIIARRIGTAGLETAGACDERRSATCDLKLIGGGGEIRTHDTTKSTWGLTPETLARIRYGRNPLLTQRRVFTPRTLQSGLRLGYLET